MKRALLLFLIAAAAFAQSGKKILVYSRTTPTGRTTYVHDNIANSVEALRKIGKSHGIEVDASVDPAVFTPDNLKQYRAIVFNNNNNDDFTTDEQRQAFLAFIQNGGGVMGIHAATTAERPWPPFALALGGAFARHPKLQKFTVQVVDKKNPATKGMPATFEWEDECYFHQSIVPGIHPLLVTDPHKLDDPDVAKFPDSVRNGVIPLAWTLVHGRSRVFYTALGHQKEHYLDPFFLKHIEGGLLWVLGKSK